MFEVVTNRSTKLAVEPCKTRLKQQASCQTAIRVHKASEKNHLRHKDGLHQTGPKELAAGLAAVNLTDFVPIARARGPPSASGRRVDFICMAEDIEPRSASPQLQLGQLATLACVLEVSACKPGNVHRGADFEDVTLVDFLASAVASGPLLAEAPDRGVGYAVLSATKATAAAAGSNTNLGTLLLLGPLMAVPAGLSLRQGISVVLKALTPQDAAAVFEAIRLARPGGLQVAEKMDVHGPAPDNLVAAMAAAADRDLVARQYTNHFAQVFDACDWISQTYSETKSLNEAIIHTHLRLMANYPDSLIARKCGTAIADESARRAAAALAAGSCGGRHYLSAVADLDFWLRADHHRRNPGTTADLVAAALFTGLREGDLATPFSWG